MPDEPIGTVDRFFDVVADIATAGIHDLFVTDKIRRSVDEPRGAPLKEYRCTSCVDGCSRCNGTTVIYR